MPTSLALSMSSPCGHGGDNLRMTSSESACVSLQAVLCPSRGFCGWLHTSRSWWSASGYGRMVSLSLSTSAWPVPTEDLSNHRLHPSHWSVSKAFKLRLSSSLDFQFFSLPVGIRHGSFRRLSWFCIRSCLIYSWCGVTRASSQEYGTTLWLLM